MAQLTDRSALFRNRRRATAPFLREAVADEVQDRLREVNRRFTAPAVVTPFPDMWQERLPGARIVPDAEVLDLPEALEPLVDYYRAISGEHPDWDEYRAAMVRQGKSLLRITVTGWGPIATGGFPPDVVDKL